MSVNCPNDFKAVLQLRVFRTQRIYTHGKIEIFTVILIYNFILVQISSLKIHIQSCTKPQYSEYQ